MCKCFLDTYCYDDARKNKKVKTERENKEIKRKRIFL